MNSTLVGGSYGPWVDALVACGIGTAVVAATAGLVAATARRSSVRVAAFRVALVALVAVPAITALD